jgi:hypothetical protein
MASKNRFSGGRDFAQRLWGIKSLATYDRLKIPLPRWKRRPGALRITATRIHEQLTRGDISPTSWAGSTQDKQH